MWNHSKKIEVAIFEKYPAPQEYVFIDTNYGVIEARYTRWNNEGKYEFEIKVDASTNIDIKKLVIYAWRPYSKFGKPESNYVRSYHMTMGNREPWGPR